MVDDGSETEVSGLLTGLDVTVVRHAQNKGKGVAILTGAAKADDMGYTHIITIDADGQHDASDLPAFVSAIEEKPDSIIVGNRDFERANVPGSSVFGRKFSNFWLRVQTGRSVQDTQSGFRAYPLSVIKSTQTIRKALLL